PAALWSLVELAGQLGGVPSEAQIARIPQGLTRAELDRAVVVRAFVPRVRGMAWSLPKGVREQRKPYEWFDWLSKAGLVEGVPGSRGTASTANDGHHCRSLLERYIDDFLSVHRIPHVVEPNWPHDSALNP